MAVDSKVTTPAMLESDGRMLSPSPADVTCRISFVTSCFRNTWRREAGAPTSPAYDPSASKAIQTSNGVVLPDGGCDTLGFAGAPTPLVAWIRYGVPDGGHGVAGNVVPCAQS
jgi:hypothetical protein